MLLNSEIFPGCIYLNVVSGFFYGFVIRLGMFYFLQELCVSEYLINKKGLVSLISLRLVNQTSRKFVDQTMIRR